MMSLYVPLGVFLLLALPQPDRLCGMVELCARRTNVPPSIAQHNRSQRTDRIGCVRHHRRSVDRVGSGETTSRAGLGGRVPVQAGIWKPLSAQCNEGDETLRLGNRE